MRFGQNVKKFYRKDISPLAADNIEGFFLGGGAVHNNDKGIQISLQEILPELLHYLCRVSDALICS